MKQCIIKQKIKYGAELESWIVDKNNFDAQAKNDWLLKELSNKSSIYDAIQIM